MVIISDKNLSYIETNYADTDVPCSVVVWQVLIPPKDLTEKLKKEAGDPKEVLKQVNNRVLWAKHQELEKKKVEEKKEKERGKTKQCYLVLAVVGKSMWVFCLL